MKITGNLVKKSMAKSPWDLGNDVLYHLCSNHPYHQNNEEIIAKVWLIGRAYAAAIERRKEEPGQKYEGSSFYEDVVVSKIRKSKIDKWLSSLKNFKDIDEASIPDILDVHYKVTDLFSTISGLEKRSLASKYLHFHYPNLFFIYDSRAVGAIRKFPRIATGPSYEAEEFDDHYQRFFDKCLRLRNQIRSKHNENFTNRHLDNLLLYISSKDVN